MVVPARAVLGDMNALELGASVALELIAIAGLVILGARIYERAILRTGAPIRLRSALTWSTHRSGQRSTPGGALS
jgi:ABC-2 type transport system permease protein